MSWYAASAIFVFEARTGEQSRFPVHENVYLIEASSDSEALQKARQWAKGQEYDDPTLTLDDRPARLRYAGLRKLISISNPVPALQNDGPPGHGTEVTYSEFTVGKEDIAKLIAGEPVDVRYEEQ
jgi:hypothetical protein